MTFRKNIRSSRKNLSVHAVNAIVRPLQFKLQPAFINTIYLKCIPIGCLQTCKKTPRQNTITQPALACLYHCSYPSFYKDITHYTANRKTSEYK